MSSWNRLQLLHCHCPQWKKIWTFQISKAHLLLKLLLHLLPLDELLLQPHPELLAELLDATFIWSLRGTPLFEFMLVEILQERRMWSKPTWTTDVLFSSCWPCLWMSCELSDFFSIFLYFSSSPFNLLFSPCIFSTLVLDMLRSSFIRALVVVRPSTLACRLVTVALKR